MNKYEIYKLQRPLATNLEVPEVLIYNEDQTITASLPLSDDLMEEIFGEDIKAYWKGRVININGDYNIELKKRVEEQPW